MHLTRRARGIGKPAAAVALAILLGTVAVYQVRRHIREQDLRHARFYNAGQTINGFLGEYCRSFEAAHEAGDPQLLLDHYSATYEAPDRGRWRWAAVEPAAATAVFERRIETVPGFGAVELAAELAEELAGLAAIDRSVCKIDLIESVDPGHRAQLTIKFILDAVGTADERIQERSFLRWYLVDDGSGWKIERDEMVEGVRVAGQRRFVEAAPESLGIGFRHRRDPNLERSRLAFGVMQHAFGGVSAADYDRDGHPDLLFLDGRECRLYRHLGLEAEGEPRFADVTDEAGLAGIDRAHTGLFADFDNDGDRDLFISRYLAPNRYYRNLGAGVFEEAGAEVGLAGVLPATSATVLDYDLDGDLDLYLGAYGNAYEDIPRLPFYARNGHSNRLFRNDGGHRFVDVTAASGVGDSGWSLAVTAADFDGDGWPDLAVANDFGRKSLYRNLGRGADGEVTFTEMAKEAGVLDFSGGMGLAVGDFDDDGLADLYTSNINSNQRWFGEEVTVTQYLRNVLRTRWALADAGEYRSLYRLLGERWTELGQQIGEGNSLFKNRGGATLAFEELRDSHTERTGWGWSVAFVDFDNDADLDLYAANGWISATPETDL